MNYGIKSEIVEFKQEINSDFIKEVIAFANTKGGVIYIGVDDDGIPVGIKRIPSGIEGIYDAIIFISRCIRYDIYPELSGYVSIEPLKNEDYDIIKVSVNRGALRPYYIASKGPKPSGVYIRLGSASIPATEDTIRALLMDTHKIRYETIASLEQDLTFQYADNLFSSYDLMFGKQQMKTLGMIDKEGKFTNLALLLSDQCRHTIKCSVFQDETMDSFLDRKKFSGSILKQVIEATDYLGLNNHIVGRIGNLKREDIYQFPPVAIREALLNAVAHRDYSFESDGFMLRIFSDKIEFFNMGGILPDADKNDILNGMSLARNPNLSNVFLKLKWVENFGSGIPRIFSQYKKYKRQPEFHISITSFRVILPETNSAINLEENSYFEAENSKITLMKKFN